MNRVKRGACAHGCLGYVQFYQVIISTWTSTCWWCNRPTTTIMHRKCIQQTFSMLKSLFIYSVLRLIGYRNSFILPQDTLNLLQWSLLSFTTPSPNCIIFISLQSCYDFNTTSRNIDGPWSQWCCGSVVGLARWRPGVLSPVFERRLPYACMLI